MEITFISDTHNNHHLMTNDLLGGPMIIHSGDVSGRGKYNEVNDFLQWFASLPYMHKIFIAGNHDFIFEKENALIIPEGVTYLQDEAVIIEGIKIYGSPWQPWFYDWAFNLPRKGPGLYSKWESIPDDVDILVTHTPPYGILDLTYRDKTPVGCEALREKLEEISPKIHVFGHIHEAYGQTQIGETLFINASLLNLHYDYVNKPVIINYSSI